ncbi:MAG: acyltransferase [Candidatus Heimdallarchaeota archaeon]
MKNRNQISETVLIDSDESVIGEERGNYFQIDALKAVMIFLVIFDHMVSWGIKSNIGVALWERISIPVFLIIMGYNMGHSFNRREAQTLKQLYSKDYFKRKILRYIVPFLVLYAFSTLYGLIWYRFDITAMYQQQYNPSHGLINLFTGILPFWGPGNWFIPVLLQSILIIPLIYWGFKRKPILTLILCFLVEITMQLTVFFIIGDITSWQEVHILNIFMTSTFFYLSAIGLGMWFSSGHKLESNRNLFMWFIYPISLVYIIAYQFFGFRYMIGNVPILRGDYHFLVFPYSAFLVLIVLKFLPQRSKNRFLKAIALIGKSTYHILLIQILGYGIIFAFFGDHYGIGAGFEPIDILNLFLAWSIFIPFGIWWYKIDKGKILWKRLLFTVILYVSFVSLVCLIIWSTNISYNA